MKILHTADWHMNSTLGRQNLTDFILASLEQIAVYLEERQVDVMLVAGDLFSERARDEGMMSALRELRRIFGPFVARGGTIIAVAGNHDSEMRFETLRQSLLLGGGNARGRFILGANPDYLRLERRGVTVQFVLLPYPTPRAYLNKSEEKITYSSLEEKNRDLQERFAATLQTIRRERVVAQYPTVLVSHVHIRGASGHTLYHVTESDDVVFDASQIPDDFAYAAYGHIHKPGPALAGRPHIRYSGSPIALDAAERFDEKGCVLFELDSSGIVGEIEILPLQGPKIHKIEIDATRETPDVFLPRLQEEVGTDLVSYSVTFDPKVTNFAALKTAIERALPGVYAGKLEPIGVEVSSGITAVAQAPETAVPSEVAREFLARRLQNHEDKESILRLAESVFAG